MSPSFRNAPSARPLVAGIATLAAALTVSPAVVAGNQPAAAANTPAAHKPKPKPKKKHMIEKSSFGATKDGESVDLYTLTNAKGAVAKIITYGGTVTELRVPDKSGRLGDVVLGFDNIGQYETQSPYFGCIVGRYANRIAQGRFTLDGQTYSVPVNNGPNALHGGLKGFDKRVWAATPADTRNGPALTLTYTAADGEEGYPGVLKTTVIYTLTDDNALRIEYAATAEGEPTVVNLTNHSYFNLAGAGDVLAHVVEIDAARYTPVDATLIPTGRIAPVAGTPLDFTDPHTIGERIRAIPAEIGGYDHNYVLDAEGKKLARAARVSEPTTGRVMEVYTTEPGVQFYTGNFLDGSVTGKKGQKYVKHAAFCLETQHFPDSPNHADFPSTVLRPGRTFRSTTEYRFSTGK